MNANTNSDTQFLSLVKMTINQSLNTHLDQERYCRNKARKARLESKKQEFSQLADKYKRLVDANILITDLIDKRIDLRRSAAARGPAAPTASIAPTTSIASSTTPLVIPDYIYDLPVPDQYICPITTQIMTDPVILTDGHVYERSAIQKWLQTHNTSPITNATVCKNTLIPCFTLKTLIEEYIEINRLAH